MTKTSYSYKMSQDFKPFKRETIKIVGTMKNGKKVIIVNDIFFSSLKEMIKEVRFEIDRSDKIFDFGKDFKFNFCR